MSHPAVAFVVVVVVVIFAVVIVVAMDSPPSLSPTLKYWSIDGCAPSTLTSALVSLRYSFTFHIFKNLDSVSTKKPNSEFNKWSPFIASLSFLLSRDCLAKQDPSFSGEI